MTALHRRGRRVAFWFIFFAFHCAIGYNFYFLSKDTINGDSSGNRLLVTPRHKFMRVPAGDLAKEYDAVDRLSGDFALIYFPACISSPKTYTSDSPDPWHRYSRYAPLVHTAFRYSFCGLRYGYASLSNILLQLSLLYLSFFIAFRKLAIEEYLLPSILLVNTCLFLTPVGLSWFERGQFSVFVTLAYLWLILGIIKRNPFYLVFSALLAYIKWTSFPFIGVVVALWMLSSRSPEETKKNFSLAILIPSTVAVLFLFNVTDGMAFLNGLRDHELNSRPAGLSLALLMPKFLAKSLPLVQVVLGYWSIQKSRGELASLMPFLAGAGILSVLYPTQAYDYSAPCLLCFIPLLIYWAKLMGVNREGNGEFEPVVPWPARMQQALPAMAPYFFCAFLLTASVFDSVAKLCRLPELSTIYLYLASAIVLIGISLSAGGLKHGEHRGVRSDQKSMPRMLSPGPAPS